MKYPLILALSFMLSLPAAAQYDVVIVGGTPGGIMAAIAAAKLGKRSVLIERSLHIGGLPANGLGATDIATRGSTTGLFADFISRIRTCYVKTYGENSKQVKDCSDGFQFEPSVAEKILEEMIAEQKQFITVLRGRQFDSDQKNLAMTDGRILSVMVLNLSSRKKETITGKVFIDATYEGDLAAAAGVPYTVGREAQNEFGEPGAGRVYKYWGGPEGDGSTFQADNSVQAYNYRLCLTNNPQNRVEVKKPVRYNREEYVSLSDDVWSGRHTGVQMAEVTEEMLDRNRAHIAKGNATMIPGDPWGIAKITNMVRLPNEKTDANNQHLAFISTDLPEENWAWPTADWAWRDKYAQRLRDYTEGLLWFAQNDKSLPEHFRKAAREWGLAKDEYQDNGNFPRQVYVREGRRFRGEYFFTAKDALPLAAGARPPVHATSVTASHYALDSHAVRKREAGRIHLDGFLSYPTQVYTVPFGVMVSRVVDNLLFPVPVSGSHIGFSTLRMEPCWMALGHAAGIASALAADHGVKVVNVPTEQLQRHLLDQGATLIYFRDIGTNDPDFAAIQRCALAGYIYSWNASPDALADEETWNLWQRKCQKPLSFAPGKTTRRDLLVAVDQAISGR